MKYYRKLILMEGKEVIKKTGFWYKRYNKPLLESKRINSWSHLEGVNKLLVIVFLNSYQFRCQAKSNILWFDLSLILNGYANDFMI